MSSPTISKGQTFATGEQITAKKLHDLVDLADWVVTNQVVGAIIYFDGTDWVILGPGTAGQVLTMNAGATGPEWVTP
jgi:UDP-N-acetylenolpyruvoylglucosamine reductase